MTKREKTMGIVIAILSVIIVFGGAYFISELKNCDVKVTEVKFEEINMVDFTTLLNADTNSLIYIARPGCGYCQQQQPILKALVAKYNFKVFYLNTDNLTQDEFDSLIAVDKKLFGEDGSQFGTPTALIVNSGKVVDSLVGLTQSEDYESFLVKNKIIEK